MKKIMLLLLLTISLSAKNNITPNEVYSQVILISDEIHYLFKHYDVKHDHAGIISKTKSTTKLKPRNTWQITYEIMIKINFLRKKYKLPVIEPVNMEPVLNLNPDLVYEQTQRILTELKIFEMRENIKSPVFKMKTFKGKTPLDVYNELNHISASLDELTDGGVTPSFVFGENMRLYDDISLILQHLKIADNTIPDNKYKNATPTDTFEKAMNILEKIKHLQIVAGLDFVNFAEFKKDEVTPMDVFGVTQMIIAELQTIKAYIGLKIVTPAAREYKTKTPVEVHQLMSWNLRKLNLIHTLNRGN